MKYLLEITNSQGSSIKIFQCESGDEEFKEYFSQFENLNKEIYSAKYENLRQYNGNHPIYGSVESFEQSNEVPFWYNRNTCVYSWIVEQK